MRLSLLFTLALPCDQQLMLVLLDAILTTNPNLYLIHVFASHLFTNATQQPPNKVELKNKSEKLGLDAMSLYELKRMKKLMSRAEVRENNAAKLL